MAADTIPAPEARVTLIVPTYQRRGDPFVCAYCCEPADTIDHTVPRWLVEGNIEILKRWHFVAVYACLDCNVRAGRKVDKTFRARRERIRVSLEKRTAKLCKTAYFDPEDITDMGHNLRHMIE